VTVSKKLFLITFILCIPCITFTSEKRTTQRCSITTFNPQRDTQSTVNLYNQERHWLAIYNPEQRIQDCYNNPHCTIKILHENDQFAGFIKYDSELKRIQSLAIEKNFRNKGYGEKLLKHAIKDLHRKNIKSIKICTTTDNSSALHLYKKNGFKETDALYGCIYLEQNTSILQSALSHLIQIQKNKVHL
jgi:ribosomal protein S18 acetylase RimI-like enzyme